jgi:hypothetical protein
MFRGRSGIQTQNLYQPFVFSLQFLNLVEKFGDILKFIIVHASPTLLPVADV